MSYSFNVYVGWFFKVPRVPTERVTNKTACTNPDCPSHGVERRTKFCQDCGQPLGFVESREVVDEQIGHWHIEEVDDGHWVDTMAVVSPDAGKEHYFIPNHRGYGVTMAGDEVNEAVVMQSADTKAEFARFKARYGAFCAAMQKAYGVKLTPVYGVVPYVH